MKRHENAKEFVCTICSAAFNAQPDLATHRWLKHQEKLDSYDCEVCGQSFPKLRQYKVHMKEHQPKQPPKKRPRITPYKELEQCSFCFRLFKNLKEHIRIIHQNERPYQCDECEKAFGTNKMLFAHKKLHLRGGPKKVRKRNQKFGKKCSSLHHLQKVKAEKKSKPIVNSSIERVTCELCGVDVNKKYLVYHMTREHQIKLDDNITCEFCGILVEKVRYASHIKKDHKKPSEQKKSHCEYCGKTFKSEIFSFFSVNFSSNSILTFQISSILRLISSDMKILASFSAHTARKLTPPNSISTNT